MIIIKVKDTELIRLLQLLIPLVTWSVVNVSVDVNDYRLIYLRHQSVLSGRSVSAKL